jgi:hypothetical protein
LMQMSLVVFQAANGDIYTKMKPLQCKMARAAVSWSTIELSQPYCTRCEQIDGVMIKVTYDEGMRGNAICPQCETKYRHVQVYNTPEAAAQ